MTKPYTLNGFIADRAHGDVDMDAVRATVEALEAVTRERDMARQAAASETKAKEEAESRANSLLLERDEARTALRKCMTALEFIETYLTGRGTGQWCAPRKLAHRTRRP